MISPDDLELVQRDVPALVEGQLLIRTRYLSLDPYMASAVRGRHMSGGVSVGDVMPGEVVGVVETSRHPRFSRGDLVLTRGGWRSFCVADGETALTGIQRILSPLAERLGSLDGIALSHYLGVLGMPGLTAYAAMTRTLKPLPGETVLIFSAGGGVGSIAGQLARLMGARVVGVVGSEEKARFIRDDLGFDDSAVRGVPKFDDDLAAATPDRIDCVLSNVGGADLEHVLRRLASGARVVLTGDMAQYNSATPLPGPPLGQVVANRATLTGFVVYDHYDMLPRWRQLATGWLREGRLKAREQRVEGLERAPEAFARLMSGHTVGKTIVVVDPA